MALWETLRDLCSKTGWCYAVFWKLKRRSRVVLTWEDAYCESQSFREGGDENNTESGPFQPGTSYLEGRMKLAVAKMSYWIFFMGEGIIGRVAFTGKHQWIYNNGDCNFGTTMETGYPDGWQAQFAAGIKTIAVIAVRQGVVQLGSIQTITKDTDWVSHVKTVFGALQNVPGAFLSDVYLEGQAGRMGAISSGQTSGLLGAAQQRDSVAKGGASKSALQKTHRCIGFRHSSSLHATKLEECVTTSSGLVILDHSRNEDTDKATHFLKTEGFEDVTAANGCTELLQKSTLVPASLNARIASGLCQHKDPLAGSEGLVDFDKYLVQERDRMWDCGFPIGDELSQALGTAFKHGQDCALQEEMLQISNANFTTDSVHLEATKCEALLDAVVGNASVSSSSFSVYDGNDTCIGTQNMTRLVNGLPILHPSKEANLTCPSFYSSPGVEKCLSLPVPSSNTAVTRELTQCFVQPLPNCQAFMGVPTVNDGSYVHASGRESSVTTFSSTLTEDTQSIMKSNNMWALRLEKPEDHTGTSRKRAQLGGSVRPRPKDRQLIQDRVRELREIVPNGSKCSIDALLEKTIRHMLFLQNVTLHAEKLKNCFEFKDDVASGASWAVKVGDEESGCPIVVKNLNEPWQMLVEVLCEERCQFLEIADIIRGLGLAILKGVMECRIGKIWTRFIVEANRDVHRVDIMMALSQRLPINESSGSTSMTMGSGCDPTRK